MIHRLRFPYVSLHESYLWLIRTFSTLGREVVKLELVHDIVVAFYAREIGELSKVDIYLTEDLLLWDSTLLDML